MSIAFSRFFKFLCLFLNSIVVVEIPKPIDLNLIWGAISKIIFILKHSKIFKFKRQAERFKFIGVFTALKCWSFQRKKDVLDRQQLYDSKNVETHVSYTCKFSFNENMELSKLLDSFVKNNQPCDTR